MKPSNTARRVRVELSSEQRTELKQAISRQAPYASRLSTVFALKLNCIHPFCNDYPHVIDELNYLEGVGPMTHTKPGQQFRRGPLAGWWHKHYFAARHMPENMRVRWGWEQSDKAPRPDRPLGNRDMNRLQQDFLDRYEGLEGRYWLEEFIQRITVGAFEERAGARKLTGDWIIYAVHNGQNYYLDLAPHSMSQEHEALYDQVKHHAAIEFPFLFA